MISLKIYNGEIFERNKWRYIFFVVIIFSVISLSIFYDSGDRLQGIISAIILLMVVGAYLFFLAKVSTETKIIIKMEGLQIGERTIPFSVLKGFVIELDRKTGEFKNIVLVLEKNVEIYTLNDTVKQQEFFFNELSKIIPLLENYKQGSMDKLMRKLKL